MIKPRFDRLSGCHVKSIHSSRHGISLALITTGNLDSFRRSGKRPILFFHGATAPTLMSAAYRIGGLSWFDSLSMDSRSVWGMDLPGYGESDPYPSDWETVTDCDPNEYGVAAALVDEIDNAVMRILTTTGADSLHIVAISRGTLPAAYYAAAHPEKIRSLTLHSPITRQERNVAPLLARYFGAPALPNISHFALSAEKRFALLRDDKPAGTSSPLEPEFLASWARDYSQRVHGDPAAIDRPVLTPIGFAVDICNAWSGVYFDERLITMPTLILRGEWDHLLTPAEGCQALFEEIAAPVKRYIQLSEATHAMLFEKCRRVLYRESAAFIREQD